MTREEKMALLRDAVPRIRTLINGLSAENLTTVYDEGEWTIAQNIHHLADMHLNTYLRFKAILTQDYPTLPVVNGIHFAQTPDANDANVEASLTMLHGIHLRWIKMMQPITDWSQTGYYPRLDADLSLDGLLDYYSEHCNTHYQQIQDVIAKIP